MTNEEKRRHRINKIFQMIRLTSEKGLPVDKEKLLAVFGVDYGISKRVGNEYIEILEMAGKIEERNDGLWVK